MSEWNLRVYGNDRGKNRDKKETQQTHRCLFGNNFGRDLFNSVGFFLCFFPCRWKYFLSIICLFFTCSRGKNLQYDVFDSNFGTLKKR